MLPQRADYFVTAEGYVLVNTSPGHVCLLTTAPYCWLISKWWWQWLFTYRIRISIPFLMMAMTIYQIFFIIKTSHVCKDLSDEDSIVHLTWCSTYNWNHLIRIRASQISLVFFIFKHMLYVNIYITYITIWLKVKKKKSPNFLTIGWFDFILEAINTRNHDLERPSGNSLRVILWFY